MTTPAVARIVLVKWAIAGVGSGPVKAVSTPAAMKPACSNDSKRYPETRVSFPNTTCLPFPSTFRAVPAAHPILRTSSGLTGLWPTRPRIPSVPNSTVNTNFRATGHYTHSEAAMPMFPTSAPSFVSAPHHALVKPRHPEMQHIGQVLR